MSNRDLNEYTFCHGPEEYRCRRLHPEQTTGHWFEGRFSPEAIGRESEWVRCDANSTWVEEILRMASRIEELEAFQRKLAEFVAIKRAAMKAGETFGHIDPDFDTHDIATAKAQILLNDGQSVLDFADSIDSTPWPELTGDEDASAFVERVERERQEAPRAQIIDLMEALKASLERRPQP